MRRFLVPVLLLSLTLLLSACGGQDAKWGHLEVTLEKVQQTEQQWTARLTVKNPTKQVQALEYNAPARYTMVIKKGEEEILTRPFDMREKESSEVLNLAAGTSKEHVVAWTFLDKEGNRVAPGTYEISVKLEAVTVTKAGSQVNLVQPKTVGPVKVTVK